MGSKKPLFLDTSILIAERWHEWAQREKIRQRWREYDAHATCDVVIQEYKRRVLGVVRYLLRVSKEHDSVAEVQRHVNERSAAQAARRKNVGFSILADFWESSSDSLERFQRYLRALLRSELGLLKRKVKCASYAGCYAATLPIQYHVGADDYTLNDFSCAGSEGRCGAQAFLRKHKSQLKDILNTLSGLPVTELSSELQRMSELISQVVRTGEVPDIDACRRYGDLLIAMSNIYVQGDFYTKNYHESKPICRALQQKIIVRPNDPEQEDEICDYSVSTD